MLKVGGGKVMLLVKLLQKKLSAFVAFPISVLLYFQELNIYLFASGFSFPLCSVAFVRSAPYIQNMPEPPPFNRLLNFTDLNDDERVHISVSIGLSGFSFLVALVPIYIYLCHRERSLIW
ncbi:membrane-associated protein, putative, partial [Bodo saltans]